MSIKDDEEEVISHTKDRQEREPIIISKSFKVNWLDGNSKLITWWNRLFHKKEDV
jgi:hypothetical protein